MLPERIKNRVGEEKGKGLGCRRRVVMCRKMFLTRNKTKDSFE